MRAPITPRAMAQKRATVVSEAQQDESSRPWWLYFLACQDGRTYAGIARDVEARFRLHLAGKGARFTRSNPPVAVLATQPFATKSDALKAEAALKKLSRTERLAWARRLSAAESEK